MKALRVGLGFLALLLTSGGVSHAMDGNVHFFLGQRDLGGEWDPVDTQVASGVQVDFGQPSWPVHLAFGLQGSADESRVFDPVVGANADLTGSVGEVSAGVLWLPSKGGSVRPYVGGGLAAVGGQVEYDYGGFDIDDDDQSVGFYANGGVYFKLGPRFHIGFDLRVLLGTEVELLATQGDADYTQLSLLLGFSWGGE
jgi:hypothetical protein